MIERNVSLKDFIGIYDNYVSNQDCEQAIKFFNDKQKFNKTMTRIASENADGVFKKDAQFFAEAHNVEVWSDTLKPLIFNFDLALKHYEKNTGIKDVYGKKDFNYTNFKIQKTLPGEGYHVWHIEHTNGFDYSNRVISYIIYLNDVEGVQQISLKIICLEWDQATLGMRNLCVIVYKVNRVLARLN